jgi:hypothetical protein
MALHSTSRTYLPLTRSHDLTPSTVAVLMKLSIRATDTLGRAVSNSTIIRALLRYAERQDPTWLRDHLFPCIEQELNSGIRVGKKKSE